MSPSHFPETNIVAIRKLAKDNYSNPILDKHFNDLPGEICYEIFKNIIQLSIQLKDRQLKAS